MRWIASENLRRAGDDATWSTGCTGLPLGHLVTLRKNNFDTSVSRNVDTGFAAFTMRIKLSCAATTPACPKRFIAHASPAIVNLFMVVHSLEAELTAELEEMRGRAQPIRVHRVQQ